MADVEDDDDDDDISRPIGKARDRTQELTRESTAFARAITSAFAQGVSGAQSFDTVLKSLGQRLSSLTLNLALKPVTNALGGLFNNISSGLLGNSDRKPLTPEELTISGAQPFATGGVIASPTYFPLGAGRAGLAGEAGPEAIMPLTRGSDGRLGVAASGSAGASVTVNIATPDADSFRRSETYLTGIIARAVARGQRGL